MLLLFKYVYIIIIMAIWTITQWAIDVNGPLGFATFATCVFACLHNLFLIMASTKESFLILSHIASVFLGP